MYCRLHMLSATRASVVYSLWSIDDQQSNAIAAEFYQNLNDDMTIAEALRAAKLTFLAGAEGHLQSPYYWGGLVLTGDNSEIRISSPQYAVLNVGLVLGLLLLTALIFGWWVRRGRTAQAD